MKKVFFVLFLVMNSAMGAISPESAQQIAVEYQENQAKCPENKPLYSNGKCYSCDTVDNIVFSFYTQNNCSKICSNRMISSPKREPSLAGGYRAYCILKKSPGDNYVFLKNYSFAGWVEKCSDDAPLSVNGKCVACNDYKGKAMKDVLGCEKCSNIIVKDDVCYLRCPDDRPMLSSNGICYSCDDKDYMMPYIIDGCEKCPNIENSRCTRQKITIKPIDVKPLNIDTNTKCGDDKPILTSDGQCLPCYYDKKLTGAAFVVSGCERCLNRKVIIGAICNKGDKK